MAQLSLFEPRETVLVNDARGRIVYTPAFVSEYEADHWFRELRRVAEWKAERRGSGCNKAILCLKIFSKRFVVPEKIHQSTKIESLSGIIRD